MNIHDGFIEKANREIDKLSADIEKKKSRIAELRSDIRKHEAEKARDSEFSERVIKLLSDNGVNSDEERKKFFGRLEDIILEMDLEKAEINADDADPAKDSFHEEVSTNKTEVYHNPPFTNNPTGYKNP